MITDPHRLFELFERGVLTGQGVVTRLVEAAAVVPPADLVPAIPPDTLEQIRALAAAPRDNEWLMVESVCNGSGVTPGQVQATRERDRREWLTGLSRWRGYFGCSPPGVDTPGYYLPPLRG